MLNNKNKANKRGMSEIILTVIMVGLVLVAVGIVWVVFSGVLTTQTETIDYNTKCTGLIFSVSAPDCEDGKCNITVERATGSKGEGINGIGITFSTATASEDEINVEGNIAATKLISEDSDLDATKATVRVYFDKENEEKYYCNTPFSSK